MTDRPPPMAKFTFTAIEGAAKELFRQFGAGDDPNWAAIDQIERNAYLRRAEKILNAARDAVK